MLAASPAWLKTRLFSAGCDSVLSLITLAVAATLLYSFFSWVFSGARWTVVAANIRFLMAGSLPVAEIWRAWVGAIVFVLMTGASLGTLVAIRRTKAFFAMLGVLSLAALLLWAAGHPFKSEEHTSDLQSLMRISYAVFCVQNKRLQQD